MKKIVPIILFLLLCITANAATKNDTIVVSPSEIERWISDPVVNAKGEKKIKYYAIYRGELLTTNKTTIEKVELCRKYKAKCKLFVIGKYVNGAFKPKRINVD